MWHRVVESSSFPTFRNFIAPSSSKSIKAPWPLIWRHYYRSKRRELSASWCDVTHRKIWIFTNASMRTSNPSLTFTYAIPDLLHSDGRTDRTQLSSFLHWLVSKAPGTKKEQSILTLCTFHVIFYLPTFNAHYLQANRFLTLIPKRFDLFHAIFSEFLTILFVTHQNDTSTNWF
jgi:hypothetical protein